MNSNLISQLLVDTQRVINHQREVSALKGELFNIFSILKVERRENETHSAFLGELLSPKGSHLKGSVFLELFINHLKNIIPKISLDIESSNLTLERYIGVRDDELKKGGRIDIYLSDTNGNSISIENKIEAIDQNTQIERYVNHNREKNIVIYLTKFGDLASKESRGNLVNGTDYFSISYASTIISWLGDCYKEAVNDPILRESIKQYQILLKKITNTMDDKHTNELENLLLSNPEASEYISTKFKSLKGDIGERLRQEVYSKLGEYCTNNFTNLKVSLGLSAQNINSQIWISSKNHEGRKVYFGIESFSGLGWSPYLFIGIFKDDGSNETEFSQISGMKEENKWWANYEILNFDNTPIELSNTKILIQMNKSNDNIKKMAESIIEQVGNYLILTVPILINYLNQKV